MKGLAKPLAAFVGATVLGVLGTAVRPAPAQSPSQAVVTYDAFRDYSSTANPVPGGAWRYGYTWSLGGALNLFPQCLRNPDPRYAPISQWTYNGWWYWINVGRNDAGYLIDWESSVRLPASDYLHVHPGVMREYSVVRFTAPGAGTYLVDAAFRALRLQLTGQTTTDIHVLHNSRSLFDGFINAYWEDGEQPFLRPLALSAGDTVDFVVGVGQNGNHSGDSTGLRATVTLAPGGSPMADAGPDQAVVAGSLVRLNGGASHDDSTASADLLYSWRILQKPSGSTAALTGAATVTPTFRADIPGDFLIELVVTDGDGLTSPPDTMRVTSGRSTYDAFRDYSSTANPVPGGAWRYGYTWSLGGALNLFPQCLRNPDPRYTPISHWTYNGWWYWISVARNDAGYLIDWESCVRLPASDYIQLHPGVMREYSVVRFTAPGAGTYLVDSAFRALRLQSTGQTTTDIHVLHNSRSLFDGFINAYWEDGEQPFLRPLALSAGDTVDFVVGVGQNGNHSADSTGLRAAVTLMPEGTPTADAGTDQSLHVGSAVTLDGGASHDDGTASADLLHSWRILQEPSGSTAALTGAATATPTFTADEIGDYLIELVVTDGDGLASPADTVRVSSCDLPPTASAGTDQIGILGHATAFSGTGTDPENDTLDFSWTVSERPPGSTAILVDAATSSPSLVPDVAGQYTLTLVVNDGYLDSTPSTVTLIAMTAADFATGEVMESSTIIQALPAMAFAANGHQSQMGNLIVQVANFLDKGDEAQAIAHLTSLIQRTDGCALRGRPDPRGTGSNIEPADWIIDSAEQLAVYAHLDAALDALTN